MAIAGRSRRRSCASSQIQRHFGGRRIDLYSGYRAPEPGHSLDSYHEVGHASDVAVDGIEPQALFEYCWQLQGGMDTGLGCGLYPNRPFVHVDARSRSVIWVDLGRRSYISDPETWLEANPVAGRPSAGHRRRRPGNRNRNRIGTRMGSGGGNGSGG